MPTILKIVPLSMFLTLFTFVLKGVTPRYRYADNKRTDEIEGYVYRVVSTETYDTFNVFVPHGTPVVSADDLKIANEQGNHILVEIEDATITPYYSERTNSVEDSIKASSIRLVNGK